MATNVEWQVGAPTARPTRGRIGRRSDRLQHGLAHAESDADRFALGMRVRSRRLRHGEQRVEWVADWVPGSTACPGWDGSSDDLMCLSSAAVGTARSPGALLPGGDFGSLT
jgi:hypothetical protein